MKQVIPIMGRELVARRDLLLLATAVMLLAVLMPLVPGTGNYDPASVRSVTSQVLALLLGCGMAIGLGISVFGRDLSAGRLGFFLARPVTARAVWFGRMSAAVVIVLVSEAVVLGPALVVEAAGLFTINFQGWWALAVAFVLLPIFLLLFAHALSVMGGARSAWLFLDLVGLAVVALGTWLALRPLIVLGAMQAVLVAGTLMTLAVIATLGFAGWAGLSVGRTDPQRTHGALSIVLWLVLVMVVVGLGSASGWLRNFGPAEMAGVDVLSVAPDGGWIEVWGTAPGRLDVRRRALVSSIDGRHVMLPISRPGYPMEVLFSADGSTAMGFEAVSGSGGAQSLWWVDLESRSPDPAKTLLVVPSGTIPAVSTDGSRVAFLEDGTVSVYELATETLVTAVRLPESFREATMVFLGEDRVRLFSRFQGEESSIVRLAEVDLEAREINETGRIETAMGATWMALNATAEHLIVGVRGNLGDGTKRFLHDAVNGTFVRELHQRGFVRFLNDGRLVSLSSGPGGARLLVESADGLTQVEHQVGSADWDGLAGEVLPGQVVVGHLNKLEERDEGRSYELLDVDSGERRPVGTGLRRSHSGFQWVFGGGGAVFWYINSPEANRFFTDGRGAVVRWAPETGELVHVVGGDRSQ